MATYNLPKNWSAFHTCFTHFYKAFNTNAKKYGYKASDIKFVNQWYKNWQASYKAYGTWNKPFQTTAFATYQAFMQNMVSMISANKNFDGNWSNWFGGSTTTTKVAAKKTTAKKATKAPAKAVKTTKTATKKVATKKVTAKKAATKTTVRSTPRAKTTIKSTKTVKPIVKKTTTKKVTAKKPAIKKAIVKSTPVVNTAKPIVAKSKPAVKRSTTARKTTTVKKTVAKKAVASTKSTTPVKKTVAKSTSKVVKAVKPVAKKSTKRVSARTSTKPAVSKTTAIKSAAPFVWFTGSKSGVNVYVGSSKNGTFSLPSGTKAAYVEVKNGSNRWKKLTQGANFPFVHNYNGNGKVQYRACWINSNGKKGSFCKPISYTNSPKAAA